MYKISFCLLSSQRHLHCPTYLLSYQNSTRVKSGIFGQTTKFGQRPRLFHISNIGRKNNLNKQTVKILMRRLIRSRLIWIYTVRKCVRIYLKSEFTRLYPDDYLFDSLTSPTFSTCTPLRPKSRNLMLIDWANSIFFLSKKIIHTRKVIFIYIYNHQICCFQANGGHLATPVSVCHKRKSSLVPYIRPVIYKNV